MHIYKYNLNKSFIDEYNKKKEKGESVIVISNTPLISLCDKIQLKDLHNYTTNNKIRFYVTTTINSKTKRQYADNVVNKKQFTPLVSIANSIQYYKIEMPNWDNKSNIIKNYAIWDLYRNSLEWLTYILDVGLSEKNENYIKLKNLSEDSLNQLKVNLKNYLNYMKIIESKNEN